jgi:hypothetical protein
MSSKVMQSVIERHHKASESIKGRQMSLRGPAKVIRSHRKVISSQFMASNVIEKASAVIRQGIERHKKS